VQRSIRTRLIISFVALAVFPTLLLGLLLGIILINGLLSQAITGQQQEAELVTVQVNDLLEDPVQRMETLIHIDNIGGLSPTLQRPLIDAVMSYDHSLNELAVLDSTGKEQARVTRREVLGASDLRDQSADDTFKMAAQTQQAYYSPVTIDQATGEPIMKVSLPLFNLSSGTFNGVLVGTIRFKPIWDLIAAISPDQSDNIYILDPSGRVVAHRDPTIVLKSTLFKPATSTGSTVGLFGQNVILATANLQFGTQRMSVVAEKNLGIAVGPAVTQGLITTGIMLLALLLAIGVGIFTVRRFIQPILTLVATAEAISQGDLTRRVDETSPNEIGTLARAFNRMTAQLEATLAGLRRNITDLEKANQEREHLIVELQEASRLKSEFLSTMSHELRTPLNAIDGFTGIILGKIAGADFNSKTEDYLNRIRANSKRLLQLINDFLDLSRIEAGRLELANLPFSPTKLVAQWQAEIGGLAEKKGVQFEVKVDPTLPETLFGDEEAVSRVALNLLGNAIKFTEQGHILVSVDRADRTWNIMVEDTGIGIPPHARDFIFDEFRQVDQSSKRKYGGTGLGLAIVQKYTRAMGGTVNLKSELAKGSTFTVTLPIKTQK
jgi:signal transduction histidine kinase